MGSGEVGCDSERGQRLNVLALGGAALFVLLELPVAAPGSFLETCSSVASAGCENPSLGSAALGVSKQGLRQQSLDDWWPKAQSPLS